MVAGSTRNGKLQHNQMKQQHWDSTSLTGRHTQQSSKFACALLYIRGRRVRVAKLHANSHWLVLLTLDGDWALGRDPIYISHYDITSNVTDWEGNFSIGTNFHISCLLLTYWLFISSYKAHVLQWFFFFIPADFVRFPTDKEIISL